jgi:short-subunit dehydrogenase
MRIDSGTRALVTGATRGIGLAVCERLAARGVRLGLVARGEDAVRELAARLPGEHVPLPADVGDRDAVERAVAAFGVGGLDLVIANAGMAHYGPLREQTAEQAEEMTRVNWLGTLWTVQFALPHLLAAGRGHIVVVSSGAGLHSFPQAAVYGATKAAQRMYADALWHELDGTGVHVTTVFPGEIATGFHDHQRERLPAWRAAQAGAPVGPLADAILRGVERGARYVYHPPIVRVLGVAQGISPALTDALLRRLRGVSAAPRGR